MTSKELVNQVKTQISHSILLNSETWKRRNALHTLSSLRWGKQERERNVHTIATKET